jgi:hypothetical protein
LLEWILASRNGFLNVHFSSRVSKLTLELCHAVTPLCFHLLIALTIARCALEGDDASLELVVGTNSTQFDGCTLLLRMLQDELSLLHPDRGHSLIHGVAQFLEPIQQSNS